MKILLQEGKRKLEMEISGSTTILQLKQFVASISGAGPAPGDQKLICKGKDLSAVAGGDDATTIEKLATLKVAISDGTKILVMRKAGSAAARAPTPYAGAGGSEDNAAQQETSAAEQGEGVRAAVQTDTVLLLRDDQQLVQGASTAPAAHQNNQFALKIKQGPNSHTVRIPSAAAGADMIATWADVATHLATYCVPDVPSPDHYRFIVKGKEVKDTSDKIASFFTSSFPDDHKVAAAASSTPTPPPAGASSQMLTVMLLFKEGHYVAKDNAMWVEERLLEIEKLRERISTLEKRVAHRMMDEDTFLEVYRAEALIAAVKSASTVVGVRKNFQSRKKGFEEEVAALDERVKALRKKL